MSSLEAIPPFLPGNSPIELKSDKGGQLTEILKSVDDRILEEAAQRPDCWDFLLSLTNLTPECLSLLKSAKSAETAMKRLIGMSWGGETINQSLVNQVQTAVGEEQTHLAKKLIRSLNEYGYALGPESDSFRDALKQSDKKKLQQSKELTNWQTLFQRFPEHTIMVTGWLRWGENGSPGLCFYSDKAMAQLIDLILGRCNVPVGQYRKTRQRLELKHFDDHPPMVIKVIKTKTHNSNGVTEVIQITDWKGKKAILKDGLPSRF